MLLAPAQQPPRANKLTQTQSTSIVLLGTILTYMYALHHVTKFARSDRTLWGRSTLPFMGTFLADSCVV